VFVIAAEKQYLLNIASVCVCSLALVIRQANRIFSASYFIVICGLSDPTLFFHVIF